MNQNSLHPIEDLRRFRTVVTVLFDEGFGFFVDRLKLRYVVPLRSRLALSGADRASVPLPVRLRRVCEKLGPAYVKFGQILSSRPDLLPPEYIVELSKLRDHVPPLRAGEAGKIVSREFGKPLRKLFKKFDAKPLAAASLAEVHRATLADGTVVAVKVRRPEAEALVRTDIRILSYLAAQLEEHWPAARSYQPVRLVREFAHWTLRELDFEQEGASIDRFRSLFADEPSLVVPNVHWPLTSRAVLTADMIDGYAVEDYAKLEKIGIDRKRLAVVGLRVGFRMFFANGFFHADPHPGNMAALLPIHKGGEPRLALYDFGQVGELSEAVRHEIIGCFLAFADKDVERYARHIMGLSDGLIEGANPAAFLDEAKSIVSGVIWKPTDRKSLGMAFSSVVLSGAKHGVLFSRELVLVGKALLTLENVGLGLDPSLDLNAAAANLVNQAWKQEFAPNKLAHAAQNAAFEAWYLAKKLPEETRSLLERLNRGEIGVKIDTEELRGLLHEFDRQNDIRVLGVLAAALLLGSVAAMATASPLIVTVGRAGFAVATVLTVWVIWLVSRKPHL